MFFQYHSCTWWIKGIYIPIKSYTLAQNTSSIILKKIKNKEIFNYFP